MDDEKIHSLRYIAEKQTKTKTKTKTRAKSKTNRQFQCFKPTNASRKYAFKWCQINILFIDRLTGDMLKQMPQPDGNKCSVADWVENENENENERMELELEFDLNF